MIKFLLGMVCGIVLILMWAALLSASEADRKEEAMWKERDGNE